MIFPLTLPPNNTSLVSLDIIGGGEGGETGDRGGGGERKGDRLMKESLLVPASQAAGYLTTLPLIIRRGGHKVSNLSPVLAQILGDIELGRRGRGSEGERERGKEGGEGGREGEREGGRGKWSEGE